MSPDDLAFPCGSGDLRDGGGLSKRELIAAMAMQGLITSAYKEGWGQRHPEAIPADFEACIATAAVLQADVLLAALTTPEAQP